MMPGLVLSSSAASSTSTAAERGPFPKPFIDRAITTVHEAAGVPSSSGKACRVSHIAVPQAIRLHLQRLNPGAEAPKICGARLNSGAAGRGIVPECGSSGSEHEPSSVSLAAMVDEFIEDDSCACFEGGSTPACRSVDARSTGSLEEAGVYADTSRLLQSLATCRDDEECKLLKDIEVIIDRSSQAIGVGHLRRDERKEGLPRFVMSALRMLGYDAGVCKTRWDHSGGLPGGDYAFVDILFPSSDMAAVPPLRLLVDIDFRAQFEIARPTSGFSALLQLVPPIFVGRPERLQQLLHIMAEATKQSLSTERLHLPPWRKLSYMKAKWFSSYKRTSKSFEGRTRKQNVRDGDKGVLEFRGIAKRGNGLDSRCTKELELLYHGEKHETGSSSSTRVNNGHANVITVMSTDWEFPALEMRSLVSLHGRRPSQKATGLASMFLQAGTLASSTIVARAA